MKLRSKDQLVDFVNAGNRIKYIYFWGHKKLQGETTKTCFSQWYDSPFEIEEVVYITAEHYMMAEKAKLFGDLDAIPKIVAAENPGKAKRLGREILWFENQTWIKHRFDIVVRANRAKFSQNPELGRYLLGTGDRTLVEASPVDKIWGVGLAIDNSDIENPNLWKGLNLLGFALMEVRDQLGENSV